MQYYLPITQPFISFHWLLVWTGRTQKGFISNHQFFKVALLALTIYNARDTFNSFIRWFKKGYSPRDDEKEKRRMKFFCTVVPASVDQILF